MNIVYLRWYSPGDEMVRCEGDDGCAALIVSGDAEKHTKWHEKIGAALNAKPWTKTKGGW
jgi:hypothetical protein